jgi:hypothetical protein
MKLPLTCGYFIALEEVIKVFILEVFFSENWNNEQELLLFLYCFVFFASQIDEKYRNTISQGRTRF